MSVFENKELGIFTLKRNEMVAGWKTLYNEDLHNWYSSPNTIRMVKLKSMRLAGHVEEVECIQDFDGKAERKRPLARPSYRCKDIREIEWGGMDQTDPAQDRDQLEEPVKVVMNIRVP
jgi:hypothetical protein